MRFSHPLLLLLLLSSAGLLLIACSEPAYLGQCAVGQLDLLKRRQPIEALLTDPATPPPLRERLAGVLAIRDFASHELHLPDNGSYRCYADLERPQVVWNVVAAPEFSLEPKRWCFPIAGCVPYRGYFSEEAARRFAEDLRVEGYDVDVYGVSAYSTLGWFDDPVLNTFLERGETRVAGLIFHELAHQQLYVKGDAAFNEAFAETVEREGVIRWLEGNDPRALPGYLESLEREEAFFGLLREARGSLEAWYAEPRETAELRRGKAAILDGLRKSYLRLRETWNGWGGYDAWMAREINNARLASVATYRGRMGAFRELLARSDGDFSRFLAAAARLANLPTENRLARLEELEAAFLARRPADGERLTEGSRLSPGEPPVRL